MSTLTEIQTRLSSIPVNTPYLWRAILQVPTEISGFIAAGNELLNDLFYDVNDYLLSNSIKDCPIFKHHSCRIFQMIYVPDTLLAGLSPRQIDYFYENGFFILYNSSYRIKTPALNIASLVDDLVSPRVNLSEGSDFFFYDDFAQFNNNPFATVNNKKIEYTNFTAPWGTSYQLQSMRFYAMDVVLTESPFFESYAGLVTDTPPTDYDTSEEYRRKILGTFLVYYSGATPNSINAAVNMFLGRQVTLNRNETVNYIEVYDPTHYEIRTDVATYIVESDVPLNPAVRVGETLPQYTPLSVMVEVDMLEDRFDLLNGLTLPKNMLCEKDIAGNELAVTVDTATRIDMKYTTNGNGIHYDSDFSNPIVDDAAVPSFAGQITGAPKLNAWSYTVWKNHLSENVFCISIKGSLDVPTTLYLEEILREALPVWAGYVIITNVETAHPSVWMNGVFMRMTFMGNRN